MVNKRLGELIQRHEALSILIDADEKELATFMDNYGRVNRELPESKFREKNAELNKCLAMDKEVLDQIRELILK